MTQDADAWITWPDWTVTHADKMDMVELAPERLIWRDVSVALAPDADPGAARFVAYLTSDQGAKVVATEGWVR